MLLRRLIETYRTETRLPEDIRAALVTALFAPLASLAAGAIACSMTALTVALIAGDRSLLFISALLSLTGMLRIVASVFYRRDGREAASHRVWSSLYDAGAWAFASLLGLLCFLTVTRTANVDLHLAVATTTAGYAAAVAARNAGRPFMAIGQLCLAILPLVAALLVSGETVSLILGAVILLFIFGMMDITLGIRDVMLEAMMRRREQTVLAARFAEQASRFDAALNNMTQGLCMVDVRDRLQVWNRRFVELLELDEAELAVGATIVGVMSRAVRSRRWPVSRAKRLRLALRTLTDRQVSVAFSETKTLALSRSLMAEGGSVVTLEDVTERLATQERIAYLARFDDLTGLANRAHLLERLRDECRLGQAPAIHLIDLDRFKVVNDTLGHPVGDALIKAVGERLRAVCGPADLIARLGGDEFVILQGANPSAAAVSALGDRLVESLRAPFAIQGHRVDAGASIGIACAPDHGREADELLKNADIALYAVKGQGGDGHRLFSPEMQRRADERRRTEIALREALAGERFAIHFQPIVDLVSGKVTACEALLRWPQPPAGEGQASTVPLSELIAVAEETGLIVEIGAWVLKRACIEAKTWPEGTRVAVNLSPVQFREPSLPLQVALALAAAGLPPERLDLEVTESLLLEENKLTATAVADLRALGVRLSLDDFGTGYSSLGYLRKYPFTKLKIDQSFVRTIGEDPGALEIVGAVAGLGERLGMRVVAEGIETAEQFRVARALGCHEGQGFLFGRPMAADKILRFLRAAEDILSHRRRA